MVEEKVGKFPQPNPEQLSPVLQRIKDMSLHYTSEQFSEALRLSQSRKYSDISLDIKIAEDSILGSLKTLLGVFFGPKKLKKEIGPEFISMIGLVAKSLARDETIGHIGNVELFKQALAEIKAKARQLGFNV